LIDPATRSIVSLSNAKSCLLLQFVDINLLLRQAADVNGC